MFNAGHKPKSLYSPLWSTIALEQRKCSRFGGLGWTTTPYWKRQVARRCLDATVSAVITNMNNLTELAYVTTSFLPLNNLSCNLTMAFNASLGKHQKKRSHRRQRTPDIARNVSAHILVRILDKCKAPRFAFEHAGLMEHKVEFGDLSVFLKDLDESEFIDCRGKVSDV